jgi:predicted dehydrogenase
MRVGIIGTGWIAEKAAITLNGLAGRARKGDASATGCEAFAVGSRTMETAQAFASKWGIPRAYGSYAELIADPDVDLVYIGTPHSHHYDVTREALMAGKPCLVEKAFMANARQAQEIIDLAHERRVFLAEAIWTRYQPAVGIVRQLIADGRIGTPRLITATLGYSMGDKPRIMRPDLCGGALLDLGVYALNFVRMFAIGARTTDSGLSSTSFAAGGGSVAATSADILSVDGTCVKSATGMDLTNAITMTLANGILANVQSSAQCVGDNIGVIAGTEGNLIIDNINNPQTVTVNGPDRTYVETIRVPQQITGYEYQFLACRDALAAGLLEPREMPHAETLYIMQLMDGLRAKWGVRYPMD